MLQETSSIPCRCRIVRARVGRKSYRSVRAAHVQLHELPVFLNQTVNPNILFLVDMGNYTLEAAYSGTNHRYWLSFKGRNGDGRQACCKRYH